jgi:hypothetical protein
MPRPIWPAPRTATREMAGGTGGMACGGTSGRVRRVDADESSEGEPYELKTRARERVFEECVLDWSVRRRRRRRLPGFTGSRCSRLCLRRNSLPNSPPPADTRVATLSSEHPCPAFLS